MSDLIPDEIQQAFDFLKERHLGKSPETYEDLRAAAWPDWVTIDTIQTNVANGIMRWIAQLPDESRRALVNDMLASIETYFTWSDFKERLWSAMEAYDWLQRWDCFNFDSDLWQAALLKVYHTFNAYFHPSEYGI
jgi:hypothetical protein